jgi:hypothetical protein
MAPRLTDTNLRNPGYADSDLPPPEPEIEAQRHKHHAGLPLQ